MEADSEFYTRAVGRILWLSIGLSATGTLAGAAFLGWLWGLAFALGAAAGFLNFIWLRRMVEGLGPGGRPPTTSTAVLFVLRYLLFAAGGYVIVKVFGMNAIAALTGLFAPAAAVIVEALYELVHGT